jgi:cyclophilin family peptidyl-prolyl cis-trans isomerase
MAVTQYQYAVWNNITGSFILIKSIIIGLNNKVGSMTGKKILAITLLALVLAALGCIGDKADTQTDKNRIVTIVTEKGTIKFELYEKEAPITTKNFIGLAESKFYDGLTFHRVEPGFVVQGGDPKGDGTGGSEKTIPLEIAPGLSHVKGAVGMARSQDPDSASSQFYFCLEDAKFLDGNYAVFGQVIEGQEVVEKIEQGDKMIKVSVGSR